MRFVQDKSRLLDYAQPFPTTVALSAVAFLIAAVASQPLSIAFLGLLLSALIGLALSMLRALRDRENQPRPMEVLLNLSRDSEISALHNKLAEALERITDQGDPIYRQLALKRLHSIAEQCALIGDATIEFATTESWRVVYEELLRSRGLHLYRSAAYIESPHYWQDGPGQQSTRLNLELHDQRVVSIERIAIIADHLWPETSLFPIDPLHTWLDEQHRHGIFIRLLRESDVGSDADLLADFGIYGNRAVGTQLADPSGKTIRFVLSFDFEKLQKAEEQWSRLAVYAISYQELLDQKH